MAAATYTRYRDYIAQTLVNYGSSAKSSAAVLTLIVFPSIHASHALDYLDVVGQITGALRLASDDTIAQSRSAGRLEIYLSGQWGSVCNDGFDSTEASLACNELGYRDLERFGIVGDLG